MRATEIVRCEKSLKTAPVFIQGIMQKSINELSAECDAELKGVKLRFPAGVRISVTGGRGWDGSISATLESDVEFVGANGAIYVAERGTSASFKSA